MSEQETPSKPKVPNRDSVTTINEDGSRFFIHPSDVRGPFTWARRVVGAGLIVVFFLLPWIPINGHPALFLDIAGRQFHIFGMIFSMEDIWLMFFFITGLGFTLFYVTALFGRIWCGWACPQTVFLDHVFRQIERAIEGDAQARRKLDQADWDGAKTFKRVLKLGLFALLSTAIAHMFMSYFVSLEGLYAMMLSSPLEHFGVFVFVFGLSTILFVNFTWFREQFCIVMCPYGRFQSALIDDNSIVIGYDEKRGEPRGKPSEEGTGDCIDCRKCVQVCPTGIDIRQGLQIECIACSNCIDACNEIMSKLKRPKGLIRYDSRNGFLGNVTRIIRPRTVVYTILMIIGASVALGSISTVKPATVGISRLKGAPYYITSEMVRNQFTLRLINKQHEPLRLKLDIEGENPALKWTGFNEVVEIPAEQEVQRTLVVFVLRGDYKGKFSMKLRIAAEDGAFEIEREVPFLGPDPETIAP